MVEPASTTHELVIQIDIPEGFTNDQVKKRIVGLALKIDDYHRSMGGSGIEIVDVKILSDKVGED